VIDDQVGQPSKTSNQRLLYKKVLLMCLYAILPALAIGVLFTNLQVEVFGFRNYASLGGWSMWFLLGTIISYVVIVWVYVRYVENHIDITQHNKDHAIPVPCTAPVKDTRTNNLFGIQTVPHQEPMWVIFFTLFTMFASIGTIGYLIFQAGKFLKAWVRPDVPYGPNIPIDNGYSLISFASMLVAIPLGLLLANVIFWRFPRVWRAFNFNRIPKGAQTVSFQEGMAGSKIFILYVVPIFILAIILFAFEPWTPKS
jgi:hypothetical protein